MEKQEKAQKPFLLEMEEARTETFDAVNRIMQQHNIPCYFYEAIINDVHRQLLDGKKNELTATAAQYEASIKQTLQEE